MRFYILLILNILYFSDQVIGQNSPILEEYIQMGLTNNLTLKQHDLDIKKSIEAVRQAKMLFYPTVDFEANYTVAAGGRKIDFPIGDLLNPAYATLNQLTQTNSFPTLENQQIQFLPHNFHETKFKFAYPLYNTDLKYNRQIKELMTLNQAAQKAAYEQELRYTIALAYLQLLQAIEAEKVWINAKSVQTELRRFNESLVKNNVATREILADADYEISTTEQEIFDLQTKQNTAKSYFNFLINRDLQSDIKIDSTLLLQPIPNYEREQSIQTALSNRKEFEVLQTGKSISNTVVDMNKANKKLPDLYIGGETGFQGFGYKFNKDQAYILARVGLTYNIYDGGAQNSKTQQARIDSDKINSQIEQVQQQIALQVTDRWNQLQSAKNAVISREKGQKAAEDAYKIINNKYRAGQVLHLEWSNAQNRVTIAQLQTVLAKLNVIQAHQGLLQATNN
jgi:outer membrane protein TolC